MPLKYQIVPKPVTPPKQKKAAHPPMVNPIILERINNGKPCYADYLREYNQKIKPLKSEAMRQARARLAVVR